MSAYTKGPWLFSEDRRGRKRVFAEDSEIVRALSTHGARRVSLDERHANARLIAAAPDLLEALKAARPHLEYKRTHTQTDQGRKNVTRVIEQADAAIAKAEGI